MVSGPGHPAFCTLLVLIAVTCPQLSDPSPKHEGECHARADTCGVLPHVSNVLNFSV